MTETKLDAKQAEGRSFSFGGTAPPTRGASFRGDHSHRQAAIEAAEKAAEAQGPEAPSTAKPGTNPNDRAPLGDGEMLRRLGRQGLEAHAAEVAEQTPATPAPEVPADPEAPEAAPADPEAAEATPADPEAPKEPEVPMMETVEEFAREWHLNGKLSDESRTTIKDRHNIDDGVLDMVMEALATKTINEAQAQAAQELQAIGISPSDFTKWASWSDANEDAGEREARWELMRSANPKVREMGIKSMQAAYAAANSSEPQLIRGSSNTGPRETFTQVMSEAMRNPLYNRQGPEGDAYRAAIDNRLLRSKRNA